MSTKYCTGCQQTKSIEHFGRSFDKSTGKHYTRHRCKLCLNQYQKDYATRLGAEHKQQRAEIKKKLREKNPVRFHVQERIAQWRKGDPESDLTTEYVVSLWNKQNGLCYYTGLPMTFPVGLGQPIPESASLDKLDPLRGYKRGNVVWACYQANTSKGRRTEQEFYDFCREVLVLASKRSKD